MPEPAVEITETYSVTSECEGTTPMKLELSIKKGDDKICLILDGKEAWFNLAEYKAVNKALWLKA